MSETRVYRCLFDDPNGIRRSTDVPRRKGIAFFVENGLWVDSDWKFDDTLNCVHWIPPSRLVLVTVVEIPNG